MPRIMSDQNNRMRPWPRRASGTKDAAPESNNNVSNTSVKAASPRDFGRKRAATTKTPNPPMTVASQILETLLKDTATALILDGNRETDMVTEVTCISPPALNPGFTLGPLRRGCKRVRQYLAVNTVGGYGDECVRH